MTATKEDFFKPGKQTPQQKADATNSAVAQILAAETAKRIKKTDHLRQLRLEREAQAVEQAPKAVRKKKEKAAAV